MKKVKNITKSKSTKYRSSGYSRKKSNQEREKCPVLGCRCFDAYPFSYNTKEPYKSPVDLRLEEWRAKHYLAKQKKEYREEKKRALAEKRRKLKPAWLRF